MGLIVSIAPPVTMRIGDRYPIEDGYAEVVGVELDCLTGEMFAKLRMVRPIRTIYQTFRVVDRVEFDLPAWINKEDPWT